MSADILVSFQLRAVGCGDGQPSVKRFTDWYDFADWLTQENLNNRSVSITRWEYVHAKKKDD